MRVCVCVGDLCVGWMGGVCEGFFWVCVCVYLCVYVLGMCWFGMGCTDKPQVQHLPNSQDQSVVMFSHSNTVKLWLVITRWFCLKNSCERWKVDVPPFSHLWTVPRWFSDTPSPCPVFSRILCKRTDGSAHQLLINFGVTKVTLKRSVRLCHASCLSGSQ